MNNGEGNLCPPPPPPKLITKRKVLSKLVLLDGDLEE